MSSSSTQPLLASSWRSLRSKGPVGLASDIRDYLRWRMDGAPQPAAAPEGSPPQSNWELNQREIQELPELLESRPVLVYAEATTRCNLRCFMCRLSFPETTRKHRQHMSLDTFARLEPILDAGSRMSLFGLGEPLLNPDFVEMLRIAKGRGVIVGLNSNAMLLTERVARAMVELEQDILVISFSGGTPESYERVITGANYGRVLANLRRLNELKRERSGGAAIHLVKPVLQLQFTAMKSNLAEIPEMVRLAIELSCAGAVVMPLTIFDPSLAEESIFDPGMEARVADVLEEARRVAAAAPFPFELQLPTEEQLSAMGEAHHSSPITHHSICHEPWQTFYARDDGTVNSCCYSNRVMGDLKSQTALEIWNGEIYRRFRARMRSDNRPAECRVCHKLRGDDWYDQRVEDETFYDEL